MIPINVIYARKSTESDDRQVLSIDSQVQELRALAARKGLVVAEVLTEAHSAKSPGRPVFGRLMRRVERGQIRTIICWKMDRLARNHYDTGAVLQALADRKLHEVITSDRTYTSDGNDRFMGNFELGIATKFIDDLRANVRRGNRARFQRGWPNYVPPLGYLNDKATKTIIKDPERFDLVRRMWELLLTGVYRPAQICRVANETWGFRTRKYRRVGGKPLALSVLYALLSNRFYTGIIALRSGETFPGAFPAMVTREEFDRVQELLGRPGRHRPKRHEFPFTGLIRCGNCGAMITAEEHVKPSGRRYVYYRCSHNRTGKPCRESAVSGSELESQIVSVLERLAIPEKVLTWVLAKVSDSVRAETNRRESARKMLAGSMNAIRSDSENLLSLRLRDLVTDEVYLAKKGDLDVRRQQMEARLAAPERSDEELSNLTTKTFEFTARAIAIFRSGSGVQRRMILEAIGLNSELRARKLRIQLKNPFQLIAEAGSISNWCRTPEDVRTWLQDTSEYFALPFIDTAAASQSGAVPLL